MLFSGLGWRRRRGRVRVLPTIVVVTLTATVSAMSVVHEDVHQRAGQYQQPRQCTEEVSAMLAEQKVRGNSSEDNEADGVT